MPLSNPQALLDRAAAKRRRMVTSLAVANAAVALLLAALVWSVLASSRQSYIAQAARIAEGLVAIAEVSIGSELDRVDAVIRATAGEVERVQAAGPARAQDVQEVLLARLELLKGVEAFRLSDAEGVVRWGNNLLPPSQMIVSDREYFQQARTHTADNTLVAGPLRSKVSGNWVVTFVRPVRLQGRFNGILYVSISAEHFRDLFERYDLGEKDAMTLRRDDLRLLARRSPGSPTQGEVGSASVSDELRQAMARHPAVGSYVAKVAVDGVERTTAYRTVSGWPFTVFAGIHNERVFQPWKRQVWTVSLLAALAWGLVAAATYIVYRSSRREALAMHSLAGQTRRIQALLRIAGDGIHIMDQRGRLVEMSDSFAEMLRSTREQLMGRHVSTWDANQDEAQIAAWLAKIKDGDKQRVDVQHRRDDGTIIDVELQMRIAEIDGELVVFGSGRDMTEAKRLAREQTAMLESGIVGMVKIEQRTVRWCNHELERMFGYAPGELEGSAMRQLYLDDESYRRVGEDAYEAIRDGRQYRTQMRMRRKNGEPIWVDLSGVGLADALSFWMAVDITAMKEAHDSMTHAAFHDALTQLPNRLLLADRLKQGLHVAQRERNRVAVCFMDLDGFKAVNDALGHEAGDALLVEVARRLGACIRPSDTAARLGGDEFVLVLAGLQDDEWQRVLDRVVLAIGQPITLPSGANATVGVTIGVALSTPGDTATDDLLERADRAMLAGKRSGKGRIFVG